MSKNGAVAKKADEGQYLVLTHPQEEVRELVASNLEGLGVSPFLLTPVKVPAGGSTTWLVPTLEGEQSIKTLEGIIVLRRDVRAYWADREVTGAPPDCMSADCVTGVGEPSGTCAECPYSQWKSDPKGGRGQACTMRRRMFLLTPGRFLPLLVSLPPTSLKASSRFLVELTSAGVPYWACEARLGLVATKNAQGQPYSTTTFGVARFLEPAERERIAAYREALMRSLMAVPISEHESPHNGDA